MNYHSMLTGAHGYKMSNEFNRKIEWVNGEEEEEEEKGWTRDEMFSYS